MSKEKKLSEEELWAWAYDRIGSKEAWGLWTGIVEAAIRAGSTGTVAIAMGDQVLIAGAERFPKPRSTGPVNIDFRKK
jgi:hypothetical protein